MGAGRIRANIGVAAHRGSPLVLPALTVVALINGSLGHSGVFQPFAVPASVLAGLRVRGARLLALLAFGALGFTVAGQLGRGDSYSFANDLFFFAVVFVGGPGLVGVLIRRRRDLVRGLAERTRRLRAQTLDEPGRSATVEERARLQRELDEVITDRVAEIAVRASGAEQALRTDAERVPAALGEIETAARAVLDDLREVLGVLRVGDEDLALLPAASLTQLERMRDDGMLALEVHGVRGQLDPAVDATAFRVAREALRGASTPGEPARISVRYEPRRVRVEIAGGRLSGESGDGVRHRLGLFGGRWQENPGSGVLELPRRVPW